MAFILDIAILSATFVLMVIYRQRIANLFLRLPLPRFIAYLVSSLPFIIFEENINCLPTGCVLIPWTVSFLLALVAVVGIFVSYFKIKKIRYPTLIFIAIGVAWEIFGGGLRGQLPVIGPIFYAFMVFWVGLSYAYLIVVPLLVLSNDRKI